MSLPVYTLADVAKHNKPSDIWIVVNDAVLDITKFLSEHPGGKGILLTVAGRDATVQFNSLHRPALINQYLPKLQVGTIKTTTPAPTATTPATPAPAKKPVAVTVTDVVKSSKSETVDKSNVFGEGIPYGDPSWYQGSNSPYYSEHHRRFRDAVRKFVDAEIMPNCHAWDEAKKIPSSVFLSAARAGWLGGTVGGKWPTKYAGTNIAGGLTPEQYDPFCELILIDEVARCGSGGVLWGLFEGLQIGLPPVLHFGTEEQRERVCGPCLRGEKVIALAITEPYAGSDVAGLQCRATKTPDGRHYIVNGTKKWITNGVWADYFTVAVRTGGEGMTGVSLLLVERGPGVTTQQMQCQGVWASGTAFVSFEDVKVPVGNLIGRENDGFKCIMYNFNHERWGFCVQAIRFARVCLEEAMRYSFKRKTFGKRLIEHPVIRFKLAQMARQVEASQSWLESITYQMCTLSHEQQNKVLAGPVALLKAQSTITFEFCAREAAQIFGGLSYTRGGQGEKVERLYREVRAMAIPAGSEEIMLDLGIRQAVKSSGVAKL